jgi:alpha-glucoside transport system substrate-binding protein
MRKRRFALLLVAPALILAGCNSSESTDAADLRGTKVTLFGPEVENAAQGLLDSLRPFEDRTGIDVVYEGDKSFEQRIGVRVDEGQAPDIALFPQPGKIKEFSAELDPLPKDLVKTATQNFDSGWTDLVTINDKLYGFPVKADLKSLVWYVPKEFTAAGYEVPQTFDAFLALTDRMTKDGKTPFCVGLESDAATGWVFTDWVEDFLLRLEGPEAYDKWVNHEIPFDDPKVVRSAQAVVDLWSKPGVVLGGIKNVAGTPFNTGGLPLLDNKCLMHRQANFYGEYWPKGTKLGPDGDVNAFYLPANEKFGRVTLSSGIYASAFTDRPEVLETMRYLASKDYADARAPSSGYLSAHKNADVSKYPTAIEQSFASVLTKADPVRFDASDQMPGTVGAGTFWTAAVDITNGVKDVPTAFRAVESSWPKE